MTGIGSTPRARTLAAMALALALATSIFGVNGVIQPTQAHTGSGDDVRQIGDFWYSLEGEAFTQAPGECDPDYDYEHTEPKSDGDASGDEVVFLPHSGCWVAFDDVHFPHPLILTNMTKGINGEAHYDQYETATYKVWIYVDGSKLTEFEFTQDKHDGLVTTDITDPVIISEGTHDIRIKYKVVEGMSFQNLRIDNLGFLKGCLNDAPLLDKVEVDGMLDGFIGWHGYDYDYDAVNVRDPDGDPVDVTWHWPDGTTATGESVTKALELDTDSTTDLLAQLKDVTLELVDDPSIRCDDGKAFPEVTELPFDFMVTPALEPGILNLAQGLSCVQGDVVDTSLLLNMGDFADRDALIGLCDDFGAATDTNGAPAELVNSTWVEKDGDRLLTASGDTLDQDLDGLDLAEGNLSLKACADAVNDKYERVFCGSGLDLVNSHCTNAVPQLDAVDVDGMLKGFIGWNRYNYTFDAATSDPDGDPVDVTWRWSDGTVASGDPVSQSFDIGDPSLDLLAQTLGLELDLADDPTVRCPDLPVLPQAISELGPDFTVAPGFDLALLNLVGSISCVEGQLMDTSRLVNLRDGRDAVVGSCDSVGAETDTNGAPTSLVDETWVQVDSGSPYLSSTGTSVEGALDVSDFTLGNVTFKGCADAVNDKYDRLFCSGIDLTFSDCLNDAPSVGVVEANGLADGLSGWSGYDYTFQTTPSDPDGDAVDVTWTWEDGTSLSGHQVDRSFDLGSISSPALQDLVLKAVDDPTVRCDLPALPEAVQTSGPSFEVVPDLQPDLPDLVDGVSCIDGDLDTLSWTDDNLLSRQCPVDAATDAGGADHVVDETMVRVDGDTIASAHDTEFTAQYDASDFADGEHFMEACATGVDDVHDRLFCGSGWTYTDVECTNRAPELADPSANGMLGGFVGWAGYPYEFTVDAQDPDGDPVTVTWNFPDGTSLGETAQRTFDQADIHDVELVVEDDTSERCPDVSDRSTTVQLTFETVDPPQDWAAALQQPSDGESCVEGRVYTTPTGEDTIAGTCEIRASLTTSGSGTGIDLVLPDAVGELRVDGVAFKQVTAQGTDQISAIYDSGDYEPGEHVLESCVHVTGDVHGLEFCSSNDYVNVAS